MGDLYLALLVMTVLALAMFGGVLVFGRHLSPMTINLLAILVVGLMATYVLLVWDRWWLTRLFPHSSLIVASNWFPLGSAALAGLIWHRTSGHPWRRTCDLTALTVASLVSLLAPIWGTPPQCGAQWLDDRFCLQTTPVTCTPASAATLLRHHGIHATEQEMAELCLTRRGTTWQGLYHGLKRKTEGTAWDVEVVRCDLDGLRKLADGPLLLRVGLGGVSDSTTDLENEMGWRPGTGHSIVLLGFLPSNLVDIADPTPSIGREQWTLEELNTLWDGQVVRLVPRGHGEPEAARRFHSLARWRPR